MFQGQPASVVWQSQTESSITGSPVIDGNGNLYVGCGDSRLYAIRLMNGNIKWAYQSGSSILSTPAVSDVGMIYFGNHGGKVIALDSSSTLHWYYQDSASVDAPLLYEHGTLYVGTTGGRLLAFYDGADSSTYSTNSTYGVSAKPNVVIQSPLWGTFHGDNQRTGVSTHLFVTKVNEKTSPLPAEYSLSQNYPNPFNPTTNIGYALPITSFVSLKVYDVLGRLVKTLVEERQTAGVHSVIFDGNSLSSGVYFYRITAGNFIQTKHLLLLK